MRFEGKVVIVTGAASGIGLATSKKFGSEGARLVLADLNETRLKNAEADVRNAGAKDVLSVACNVGKEEDVIKAYTAATQKFGYVDVVVNNAGIMKFKKIEEHSADDWTAVLSVDLLGTFFFIKQAFLNMKRGGSVINVSSVHAVETEPLVSSYAAAKAGVLSLTRSACIEGKPKGIRVNAILPGAVDTPMLWENPNVKAGVEKIDPNDVGKPEDIANAIAYLASDEAKFIQGASMRVDGGRLAKL